MDEVARFYRGETDDAWRREWLARYRVTYVFIGPRERALGAFDATRADYLDFAFSNSAVTIYRVK